MTTREIALLRLASHHIAGPGLATAGDVVRWLTAVQAQDYPGALTSVALRTRAGTRRDVEVALDSGELVRSWPMRGTLHLVPAEDLSWMLDLTTERVLAGAASRRAELGLDDLTVERARALTVDALSGGRRLGRVDLRRIWDDAGLLGVSQRGYHLLWVLSQTGTLCYGPVRDGEQQVVLVEEWVTRPRRMEREEALGEWALRYFRSHGPATVADFAWWTKLLARDVRAGVAVARPRLERVEVDGVEYLMDPATPGLLDACRRRARGVFLLPGFDEYMLGYRDRGAALPAEFAQRIVPGRNGVFSPTVVAGGQVVGTWKRAGSGARRTLLATPFTAFPARVEGALGRLYDALP